MYGSPSYGGSCSLGLLPRDALAEDAGAAADGGGFCGVTFSHIVPSEERVDAVLAEAERRRGRLGGRVSRSRNLHCPSLSLVDEPKPQRPRIPCWNRSRSSGVMCPHRSAMRRRKLEPAGPWSPNLPKRIRHSVRMPSACQKVTWRQPKSGGSSQFHSCHTTSPPIAMNSTNTSRITGARRINRLLMFSPSPVPKCLVNALQSLAQMQHRIALSREQGIHAHAGLCSHLLEAAPFQLVRNEHLALLLRQLVDRPCELIEKHGARVERLRPGIGRRQQVFHVQPFVVLVCDSNVSGAFRLLLAEEIRDAITRHAK